MATAARSSKGTPIKKAQDSTPNSPTPARRPPAWGANRASISPIPPFTPNANNTRPANGFPPLAQPNGKAGTGSLSEEKENLLASLAASIGSTITVTLRTNVRYEGILTAVTPSPLDSAGLTLKDAKDLSTPSAPQKDTLSIHASNVASFQAGSSAAGGNNKAADSFRTDTDISRTSQPKVERDLQPWQPDSSNSDPSAGPLSKAYQRGDDVTFGPSSGSGAWDQFATNERLFGVTTQFDEDAYTTKLDRTAKDYKEREKRAERIAAEITGSTTLNPHIAEERNLNVDDSGMNEEDKFGAVVRGANAYVPPGARRTNSNSSVTQPSPQPGKDKAKDKPEVPQVSVNAPDGSEKTLPGKTASPLAGGVSAKPPADAFRDFVTNEKQRLTQKRQAIVKSEMDKRMADLLKFSQNFKLNKPIPEDLVPILAKDEEKQRQIREKTKEDAVSAQARTIGVSSSIVNAGQAPSSSKAQTPVPPNTAKPTEMSRKVPVATPTTAKLPPGVPTSKSAGMLSGSTNANTGNSNGKLETSVTMPRINMVIQSIPAFRGGKAKQSTPSDSKTSTTSTPTQPLSPTAAQRLNVNAISFRPNPKAVAFTPNGGSASPSATASPKAKTSETSPSTQPNPFFGTQVIKKNPPVNVKDDFNPFKYNKVAEASAVAAIWPYNGKRYMQMFPPPPAPPPQASPHMAPHGPPPPPPPSYDEDAAAQAAARGYAVYAYAPYSYPGQPHQPMMAGMGGVPPGAFVPSPYMQHMPYPPSMPPPNGQPMYAPPPMGQMHPPQPYMSPPPPGAYPPPPNGSGPRPSMPPTPIPTHAHPYYHQSPQMQHAMPYPMMMPPPGPGPNGPPHPYEGGPPPVPMGSVGHA